MIMKICYIATKYMEIHNIIWPFSVHKNNALEYFSLPFALTLKSSKKNITDTLWHELVSQIREFNLYQRYIPTLFPGFFLFFFI